MRKGLQRAAIVIGLAALAWWLLPAIVPFLSAGLVLGVAAVKAVLTVLALGALWLVSAMLWDSSKYLYRRYIIPCRRARRINRIRDRRNWREAASRGNSGHR
jgi:hypothetical protein